MSNDTEKIDYRAEVLQALDKNITSYKTFIDGAPNLVEGENSNDSTSDSAKPKASKAKLFQDHHVAAKAAIAHIEMLLKAARLMGIEIPPRVDRDVTALMKLARAESDDTPQFDDGDRD